MGDEMAHGGVIALGCFTVLIGDAGGGGGGGAGAGPETPHPCLKAAAAAGAPFVRTK